jgi:hypothetical protein
MSIPEIFTTNDARKFLQQYYDDKDAPNPLTTFGTPVATTQVPLLNKQYPLALAEKERIIMWHPTEITIPTSREVLFYNIEAASRRDEFRRTIRTVGFGKMESIDEITDELLGRNVRDHLSTFYGKKMNGTGVYSVWNF